jgi:hypothetical protein
MQDKINKLKKLELPDVDKFDEKKKFIHKMCVAINKLMQREINEFYEKNPPSKKGFDFSHVLTLQMKILSKYCSATLSGAAFSLDVPVLNLASAFTGDILNQTEAIENELKDI